MAELSEFDKFIKGLSDHELSIFVGYKFDTFLSKSKIKIKNEINHRGLTRDQLHNYFNQPLNINSKSALCKRCGSDRLFTETDYEHRPKNELSSVNVAIDTNRCRLCGYNPDKEISGNIFSRIVRYFKNNKTERIVDWDSL